MLPVIQAIGAGLGALSALKNLTSSWSSTPAPGSSTSATSAATPPTPAKTAAPSGSELQDRFLRLLVTQMKNQDPLNPLDNAQVTTQLAQISTVGGIDKLNSTLAGLSSTMLGAQSVQSSAIIGREVYAIGSQIGLENGKAVGAFDLKEDADRVFVTISDASGALIRSIEFGAAKAGMSAFEWDGKTDAGMSAKSGTYVFQATAARGNTAISVEPMMAGRVDGISLSNGIRLNLQGGGEIGMADVKRIL